MRFNFFKKPFSSSTASQRQRSFPFLPFRFSSPQSSSAPPTGFPTSVNISSSDVVVSVPSTPTSAIDKSKKVKGPNFKKMLKRVFNSNKVKKTETHIGLIPASNEVALFEPEVDTCPPTHNGIVASFDEVSLFETSLNSTTTTLSTHGSASVLPTDVLSTVEVVEGYVVGTPPLPLAVSESYIVCEVPPTHQQMDKAEKTAEHALEMEVAAETATVEPSQSTVAPQDTALGQCSSDDARSLEVPAAAAASITADTLLTPLPTSHSDTPVSAISQAITLAPESTGDTQTGVSTHTSSHTTAPSPTTSATTVRSQFVRLNRSALSNSMKRQYDYDHPDMLLASRRSKSRSNLIFLKVQAESSTPRLAKFIWVGKTIGMDMIRNFHVVLYLVALAGFFGRWMQRFALFWLVVAVLVNTYKERRRIARMARRISRAAVRIERKYHIQQRLIAADIPSYIPAACLTLSVVGVFGIWVRWISSLWLVIAAAAGFDDEWDAVMKVVDQAFGGGSAIYNSPCNIGVESFLAIPVAFCALGLLGFLGEWMRWVVSVALVLAVGGGGGFGGHWKRTAALGDLLAINFRKVSSSETASF